MVEVSVVSRFHNDDKNMKDVLDILNYAWVPQIISRLDYYGQLRFNQLKRSIRGISSTSLSRSLSLLHGKGLLRRTVYETSPPKVTYALSVKGQDIGRIMASVLETGKKWNSVKTEELEVKDSTARSC